MAKASASWLRDRRDLVLCVLLAALVALAYALLFGRYRAHEVDDAWHASFAWTFSRFGWTQSTAFGGTSTVQYFGHLYLYLTAVLAEAFGWQKATFHVINHVLMGLSACCWYAIARRHLKSGAQALAFVALLFTVEIVMGAANKARSDAFAFLMVSGSLLCALSGRWFPAMFLVCLGIETHPIGGTGFLYCAAVFVAQWREGGTRAARLHSLPWGCLGLLAGLAAYFLIHPVAPWTILAHLQAIVSSSPYRNAFQAHVLAARYYRFALELPYLVAGIGLLLTSWRRPENRSPHQGRLLLLLAAMFAASLVFQRGNPYYVLFFYCVGLLAAFAGFAQWRHARIAFAAMLLLNLSFAAARISANRAVDHEEFYAKLEAVSRNMDPDIPVFGLSSGWFNFKDRQYVSRDGFLKYAKASPQVYLIHSCCDEQEPPCCIEPDPLKVVGSFLYNGSRVTVTLHENRCGFGPP